MLENGYMGMMLKMRNGKPAVFLKKESTKAVVSTESCQFRVNITDGMMEFGKGEPLPNDIVEVYQTNPFVQQPTSTIPAIESVSGTPIENPASRTIPEPTVPAVNPTINPFEWVMDKLNEMNDTKERFVFQKNHALVDKAIQRTDKFTVKQIEAFKKRLNAIIKVKNQYMPDVSAPVSVSKDEAVKYIDGCFANILTKSREDVEKIRVEVQDWLWRNHADTDEMKEYLMSLCVKYLKDTNQLHTEEKVEDKIDDYPF